MNFLCCCLLAVLSIWDYPARQPKHERLRRSFLLSLRTGDSERMLDLSQQGVRLLPDDPTWRYNLACSLARVGRRTVALEALEKAVVLGFRDVRAIATDDDLKRIRADRRFAEILKDAQDRQDQPILMGPMASMPASGLIGSTVVLGEQNLLWDFDAGCFVAKLTLETNETVIATSVTGTVSRCEVLGNAGDLYMNRDNWHSGLNRKLFPGVTEVKLDRVGRARRMALSLPNMLFPAAYPVFGNASLAMTRGATWRSLPRAMMTLDLSQVRRMERLYLANQVWVFPAHMDYYSPGTNGDCFASVTPYCLVTQGRSWSDQYYLRAALEVSRSLDPGVKREIVRRGLLAPTVQTLIRKSLKGVTNEVAYLTAHAHPTALPPNGLDLVRLKRLAKEMRVDSIPPLAAMQLTARMTKGPETVPECLFSTRFAAAIVLRGLDARREFGIKAVGGEEYAIRVVHGDASLVQIERVGTAEARVTVDRSRMKERIDIAVFARAGESGWGAPSFLSLSVPPGEKRTWRADGKTATIDYRRDPGVYADPVLFPKRNWMEAIEYDEDGCFSNTRKISAGTGE